MNRILVTGASGFLGRFVPEILASRGYQVHLAGRHLDGVEWPAGRAPEAHLHTVDMFESKDVQSLLRDIKPTHLLHLAWYAEPGKFWHSPKNLDWVAASLMLFRAFAEAGGQRFVGAGTCAEYDWDEPVLSPGVTPLRPSTLYGESKARLFQLLDRASRDMGISFAWGRIFFPFGPFENPDRLLPQVVRGLIRGVPIDLSEGRQVRDFIYSEDAASLFADLVGAPISGAVNIASGEGRSIREFVELALAHMGSPELLRFGARSPGNDTTPVMIAGVSALEAGWRVSPPVGVAQGITRTIAWWRTRQLA